MGHESSANAAAQAANRSPANRIGLDYRAVPAWKTAGPLIDVHTHVKHVPPVAAFFEAAALYGVQKIYSMSPLGDVDALRADWGARLEFIAIPNWKQFGTTPAFQAQWLRDLETFREKGARLCKFWMAPPAREKHGLTLQHEFMQPLIRRALDLGYDFMVHVGDPSVWWREKYKDAAKFGTKADQYPQLEFLLQAVAPRFVIAAHMGGSVEDLDFLQGLLDRHPNLFLDSSATKWIVREVSRQPDAVRAFFTRNPARILFGSDVVVDEKFDFEHYASRYWAQRTLWETAYRGESPIEDPDAEQPPRLAGADLPATLLPGFYGGNAARLLA